jgi:hypothetical protein
VYLHRWIAGASLEEVKFSGSVHLKAVTQVYQRLFEKACFLRRDDDREGNIEFYQKMMVKSITYLDRLAYGIRHGLMSEQNLEALLDEIDLENNEELVGQVEQLQQLRSWLLNLPLSKRKAYPSQMQKRLGRTF